MQYQTHIIDSLFKSSEPLELSKDIISKRLVQGIEIEVTLKTPDDIDQKDIIKLKPMGMFECREFGKIFVKHSAEYYANVNEILSGNGKLPFIEALEEYLLRQNKTNTCGVIEYNGSAMHISEIKANIFDSESEYENRDYIFSEIVDFFCWSYCFFLGWKDTAIVYIAECNLIQHQYNMIARLRSEQDSINQSIEMAQQVQVQAKESFQQMQEKLKDTQQSKKTSKKKLTGSNA
jgi:hypothetical protein